MIKHACRAFPWVPENEAYSNSVRLWNLVLNTYFLIIFTIYINIRYFINKIFHNVFMAISGCNMQWSPLIERKEQILRQLLTM